MNIRMITFFLISNLNACDWCGKIIGQESTTLESTTQESRTSESRTQEDDMFNSIIEDMFSSSGLDAGFLDQIGSLLDNELDIEVNKIDVDSKSGKEFYNRRLAVFFCRALWIVDHFYEMCPGVIASSLDEVVELMSDIPWYYFQNTENNFNLGEHWEIILGQYDTISSFLETALVDPEANKVLRRTNKFRKGLIHIENYWRNAGIDIYYKFHAHHFDYVAKMFNEGIRLKDFNQAERYYSLANQVIKRLNGSVKYESYYKEKMKIYEVLLEELRKNFEHE